jgi:hypothetical protein
MSERTATQQQIDAAWTLETTPPDRPSYHGITTTAEKPGNAFEQAYWTQYEGRMPIIGFGERADGSVFSVTARDLVAGLRR